jgi:hypothetical protein
MGEVLKTVKLGSVIVLGLLTTIALSSQSRPAYGQDSTQKEKEALDLIRSTAEDMCEKVPTEQKSSGSDLSGQGKAQLGGLAGKIADLGVSGSGQKWTNESAGILQKDLAAAINNRNDCKIKVLEILSKALLPENTTAAAPDTSASSGSPPPSSGIGQLPDPGQAMTSDVFQSGWWIGPHSIAFYKCLNGDQSIVCYFVWTRLAGGSGDLDLGNSIWAPTRLVDNFRLEHRMLRAYAINGLGGHQQTVNLDKGDSTWIAFEFDPGPQKISHARIVFPENAELKGPVN